MYPMDFEEFAWAMGEEQLIEYIRKGVVDRKPLEQGLHAKAMLLFRQYMIVGGMPQSLSAFIENDRDFAKADTEKRDILTLYRKDIMRIDSGYRSSVLAIYDQIPAFLSKSERRIIMSKIDNGASFPKYHDTFFWLSDSMIANECFNCADPNVGLSLNEDRTYVKCYMGDTGLLISHTFDENEISDGELYRELLFGKLSLNEGMFYENAIAQMLVASGHKLYFYVHYDKNKHRNDIEIDFIISNRSKLKYKIFPIEVKSSERYSTLSLSRFREKYSQRIGGSYIIHPKNLKEENGVLYLPAYMAFCL
jgi:predicted AAA+ superfamily ATPase